MSELTANEVVGGINGSAPSTAAAMWAAAEADRHDTEIKLVIL
jgi:hypothetical protein